MQAKYEFPVLYPHQTEKCFELNLKIRGNILMKPNNYNAAKLVGLSNKNCSQT